MCVSDSSRTTEVSALEWAWGLAIMDPLLFFQTLRGMDALMLFFRAISGIIIDYPNLGNGFGQARKYQLDGFTLSSVDDVGKQTGTHLSETTLVDAGVDFTLGFSTPWFKMVFNPDAKWSRSQTRELIGFVDVNGVGVPDVVTVTGAFLKDSGRRVQSGHSFPENKDLLQP